MQNPYGWFCTRRWGGAISVKIFIWVLYIDVENQWFPQDFCSTNRGFSKSMLVYTRVSCKILWILWDHPEKKMSASFQASTQRNDISMSISIIFANSKKGWCLVLIPSRWRKFCDHLTCCVFFDVSCDDTCFSRTYLAHLQLYHIHITYSNPFVTLFGIFLGGYEIYDDKWSWLWVNNDKWTSEWTTITVFTVVSWALNLDQNRSLWRPNRFINI